MKRNIIIGFVFLGLALAMVQTVGAQGVYQLPNGGFETWDGSSNTSEPTHWNSFASSDGTWSGLASSTHHYRRDGSRPGGDGQHYLTIYTLSIIGVKANGNMTTGRIHAGSLSATSSDNYNYTERSNSDHSQPFTATPDSMYVWVSFYAGSGSSTAQVEAILHGDNDFRAPNHVGDASKYCGRAVAQTQRTTTSSTQMQWQQLRVPFVYDGATSANYMLVNMTTNTEPGSGDADDSLSIDDIVFIYSAWLKGIDVDGVALSSFSKDQFTYKVHVSDTGKLMTTEVTARAEAGDATITTERNRLSDTSAIVSLRVTAEDGVTVKEYSVVLSAGLPDPTEGIDIAEEAEGFLMFPNPAVAQIWIEAEGEVSISDMSGRQMMTFDCHGKQMVDISHLPEGVYVVRHKTGVRRLVKTVR